MDAHSLDTNKAGEPDFSRQPVGLYRLFFAELWERFSFYGMRALLILYMTRQLLYSDNDSYAIYAAYGALVYATPMLGGYLADKILGYRNSIILGGVLMAIGHFVLAIEQELFFFGALAFIIMGNGFFKPNISSMVGSLYSGENDPRRDKGFTIFYMGINAGALLAPLLAGTVGEVFGWHYGFGIAGIGMVIGLLVFLLGGADFKRMGTPPDPALYKKWAWPIYIGAFLFVPIFGWLVYANSALGLFLPIVGVGVLVALITMALREEPKHRDRLFVVLILTFFATMFWAFFEQAGSSITLFTDRNVDRLGIPTSSFQSVNPSFIVLLAPVFSWMWMMLGRRNLEPSTPMKFGLGILQLGLGFGVFVLGAMFAEGGEVALLFLILGYLLHTTGELSLSPIGLSMVTKLSPAKVVSFVMGAWLLSSSFAHYLGGAIAKLTSVDGDTFATVQYTPMKVAVQKGDRAVAAFDGQDSFTLLLVEADPNAPKDAKPRSSELKVNIRKAENGETNLPARAFTRNALAKPGQKAEASLLVGSLDPTGENSSFKLLPANLRGSLSLATDGKTVVYTAPAELAEATLLDTVPYQICDTRGENVCDTALLIFTVTTETNPAPVPYYSELTLYSNYKSQDFLFGLVKKEAYTGVSLSAFDLGYSPSGHPLRLEVPADKGPTKGLVSTDSIADPRISKARSLIQYSSVFSIIFLIASATGLLLMVGSPIIKKMMHGVN